MILIANKCVLSSMICFFDELNLFLIYVYVLLFHKKTFLIKQTEIENQIIVIFFYIKKKDF